jgi:hypothetical protein
VSWGGLNPALTAWREGINLRFPSRGTGSDGGYADAAHGSTSQHQPDADGTVDAFDNDVNYLGSGTPTGTALERRIAEALKLDFQADVHGRGLLWIHRQKIANAEIRFWTPRAYSGSNKHDQHIHFQSRQSKERDGRPWRFIRTDALLREISEGTMTDAVVTGFSTGARDILKAEATEGGLGYVGGGLPTWEGKPTGANFLNAFTHLFGMVQDLQAQVVALQATADEIKAAVIVPDPPESPIATATKAGRVKPGK